MMLDKNFQIASADLLNVGVLVFGLFQFYRGIEIAHPVFKILFCNLFGSLVSSIIIVFVSPFITADKLISLVNSVNITYLMFHCCCWTVLSILRFIYLNHNNWLFVKYPESSTVSLFAILGIFLIYFFCLFFIIIIALLHGWPKVKVYEMSLPGANFMNSLLKAFTCVDPKSTKNTVKSSVSFCAFGICTRKSCS